MNKATDMIELAVNGFFEFFLRSLAGATAFLRVVFGESREKSVAVHKRSAITAALARLIPRYGCISASSTSTSTTPLATQPESHSSGEGALTSSDTFTECAAEDDDNDALFAPLPPRPECPICMLTLPLGRVGTTRMTCCGNFICSACVSKNHRMIEEANEKRRANNPHRPCLLEDRCPLCRGHAPESDEEAVAELRERMERNQAYAFFLMAQKYDFGYNGVPKDERKAFELYNRAADLGCAFACFVVATCFCNGDIDGVEKDEEKSWHYFVLAAKGGCVDSRFNLGKIEFLRGNKDLAFRHWWISAAAGCDDSIECIMYGCKEGLVAEAEYAAAKNDHQKAKDEMRSDERDHFFLRWCQKEKQMAEGT